MAKFLSLEDRLTIARGLREQLSFGEIASELKRDRSTIAKRNQALLYHHRKWLFLLQLQCLHTP